MIPRIIARSVRKKTHRALSLASAFPSNLIQVWHPEVPRRFGQIGAGGNEIGPRMTPPPTFCAIAGRGLSEYHDIMADPPVTMPKCRNGTGMEFACFGFAGA